MKNKKGLVMIVEAVIAVLLVLGALLVLASQKQEGNGARMNEVLPVALEEIAKNSSLRAGIIKVYKTTEEFNSPNNAPIVNKVEEFLEKRMNNAAYNYTARICGLNQACEFEPNLGESGEIFSAERVISTAIDEPVFEPRKVKLFLWKIN